ncbi:unnamed protein product [Durusdinium trenchii]|uniref:Magnesium transporter n=1 Tax=Durusdinium trenchii TaxID=1381693 RepID=A0ABP0L1G6_9DINO
MIITTARVEPTSTYVGYLLGLCLCIAANFLTALGITIQKSAHVQSKDAYYARPLWIFGVVSMIIGALLNMPALAFVPQTVVSILGSLTIVFNACLAKLLLHERLYLAQVMVMMLLIAGASLVVMETPVPPQVLYVDHIFNSSQNGRFLATAFTVMILLSFLLFLSRFSLPLKLVFLATACGACGCYATAFVKTIGEIIANTAGHQGGWLHDPHVYCLGIGALCIFLLQILVMQTALGCSDAVVITPTFFAMGVLFTIFQAQLAFGELNRLKGSQHVMLFVFGVLLVLVSTWALLKLHEEKKEETLPLANGPETAGATTVSTTTRTAK